jgi:hypothetical protein
LEGLALRMIGACLILHILQNLDGMEFGRNVISVWVCTGLFSNAEVCEYNSCKLGPVNSETQ